MFLLRIEDPLGMFFACCTPSTRMIAAPVMPPHLVKMTQNVAQRARRKLANSVDVSPGAAARHRSQTTGH